MWESTKKEAESAERQAPDPSEEREKQVMATKALPEGKTPREKAIENISEGFKDMPSKKVVEALLELSAHYDADFLGFEVFPHLKIRLSTDVELFRELVALLVRPPKGVNVTEDLGYVLLEFLDTAAHGTGLGEGILQEYRESMKKVIMNKKLPGSVRARATRSLTEEKTSGNVDVVQKLIKSGSRELVDAAARVLWAWSRISRLPQDRLYPNIVKNLAKHAKSKPDEIFESPSVMRLFGYLKTDTANDVLNYLIKKAKKPEHWGSLLSSVGSHSSPDQLAKMIQGVTDEPTPLTVDVLTGVISNNPGSMEKLFTGGHHQQYAFALATSKIVDYPGWATHLTQLHNSTEPIVAQFARGVTQVFPHEKQLELHGVGSPKARPISGDTSAGEASDTGIEEGTVQGSDVFRFAYRGDALYNGGTTSHWHAGLYLGFSAMPPGPGHPSSFWMRGIHNARVTNGVLYFRAEHEFHDPNISVAFVMGTVADTLLKKPRGAAHLQAPEKDKGGFDCVDGKQYHGRRSPPELDADTRAKITETAIQFHGRGIDWYFEGMIRTTSNPITGKGWKGTIAEIDATRCDGLVEYCYEKNWEPVCQGKRIEDWRIASAGKEKLDSHEEFHTMGTGTDTCGYPGDDWTQGELCPKTQAGDAGTDTTFERGNVEPPEIIAFHVTNSDGDIPPKITFEIRAPYSQNVFVRVTVSKDGDSFDFMMADDYWRCGMRALGTPEGKMNLMELPHNGSLHWFGKTAEMDATDPGYWGDNRKYWFRLEVVDQGGNVSKTHYFNRNLDWPETQPEFLLSEHSTRPQRVVSIVNCTWNTREATFPVRVDKSLSRDGLVQKDALSPGGIQEQGDDGISLPPSPIIRDIYDLKFNWEGTADQSYTILVDGIVSEEYRDRECTSSPVEVPLHFIIKADDSYMREVTVQLGESDCADAIIVELTPPSISAVPYMHQRSGAVYLLMPEDAISDAEISKDDVVIVDEDATEADLSEQPGRAIFVKGVPAEAPAHGPDALECPVIRYSYSWGYIKNPVYCDFDMVGLITPSTTRGSVKTLSNGNLVSDDCTRAVEDITREGFRICQSDSFFNIDDYNSDVQRVFEFATTDVARQRVTGQLTFYAKSLLCILENDWVQYNWALTWGSLKDQLAIRISEDLIMNQIGLGWDEKIALDQNLHEFAKRLSVSMEPVLDTVLNDQSTWARIRDEAVMIVRRNEKQLTELLTGSSGIENVEAAVEEINHSLATEYIAHIMNTLSRTALEMPEHQEGFREIVQREL